MEASSPPEHIFVRHSCPRTLERAKLWAALPEEKTTSASSSNPRGRLNSTRPLFPSRASTYCRSTGGLAGRRPTSPCATLCPLSFSIAFATYRPLSSATRLDYDHPIRPPIRPRQATPQLLSRGRLLQLRLVLLVRELFSPQGSATTAPVGAPSARAKASIRQPGAFAILGVAPGVEGFIS